VSAQAPILFISAVNGSMDSSSVGKNSGANCVCFDRNTIH